MFCETQGLSVNLKEARMMTFTTQSLNGEICVNNSQAPQWGTACKSDC